MLTAIHLERPQITNGMHSATVSHPACCQTNSRIMSLYMWFHPVINAKRSKSKDQTLFFLVKKTKHIFLIDISINPSTVIQNTINPPRLNISIFFWWAGIAITGPTFWTATLTAVRRQFPLPRWMRRWDFTGERSGEGSYGCIHFPYETGSKMGSYRLSFPSTS